MPRQPADTKMRRFMMQGIMWVILVGTVGLAALVDRAKQHSSVVKLGDEQQFREFSIRLPQDWQDLHGDEDPETVALLHDPATGDVLAIVVSQATLKEQMGIYGESRPSGRDRLVATIPIGDETSGLFLRKKLSDEGDYDDELLASRALTSGNQLTLILGFPDPGRGESIASEIDVIKRVAASVKVGVGVDAPTH